ncbi:hypothetical protein M409DRAFT_51394 [Zasmidium cellare ATCC 36951]|uniref:Ecp2 effector protein domain-containing protein n=1 Tax=Zasmidium cellare ATCC 36951 TaxID=1080233 RepID=A0A6A6CWZ6_ZASCE|nr:uncharacterized protein M409DRAFT_51394 [Zasmidium cellare ATCC 36951]KAF2170339.1 hypothetical protein M409DRAFT_51394 [Zasmidium cellare ATCC 36951]
MQFATTILTLLAATSALAAPVDSNTSSLQARKVAPEQSTCKAYRNDMVNVNESVFIVTLGRPYLGGGRCKELRDKINGVAKVNYMKCSGSSGKTNTKLAIHSDMQGANIANMNRGLKAAYPEIKFNCPTSIYNP